MELVGERTEIAAEITLPRKKVNRTGKDDVWMIRRIVLGIETSCDDTCVAVLQCADKAKVLYSSIARSLDENEKYGGIHPIVAVKSHEKNIDRLVSEAEVYKPDLIAVTQGPGMAASLRVGINAAQKLGTKLGVPVIGVHHMQAHALTPRLLDTLQFPYTSLLVSGGHTLLLRSKSVSQHDILATTLDIAIGDCIDKIAKDLQVPWNGMMPGAALEAYSRDQDGVILSPQLRAKYGIKPPLHAKLNINGVRHDRMDFSFSGLGSCIARIDKSILSDREKRALGGEAMKACFEHVTDKVIAALKRSPMPLVLSGGVARNAYLREMMQRKLDRNDLNVKLICPPLQLCSDNAVMIAWTAHEMMPAAVKDIVPRPKWSLNQL